MERDPRDSAWVTRDGVSLHYERTSGDPDSETVVFLAGLGYGRWMWRWQREALRNAGYDIIVPDIRGTGQTPASLPPLVSRLPRRVRAPLIYKLLGHTVQTLTADLEAVLADAGVLNAHLVGAGLGGMIAQQYAHSYEYSRARSLTLVGTAPGGSSATPIPDDIRTQLVEGVSGSTERERFRTRTRPAFSEHFTNRNPHLLDRILEWRLEQDPIGPALEAQASAMFRFDAGETQLQLPTLVLHGTDDRIVPFENATQLATRCSRRKFVALEDGPHLCMIEQADAVTDQLCSFLEDPAAVADEKPASIPE